MKEMNAKCLQQRERSFRAAEQKTTQKATEFVYLKN